jgi:hypothetical protein
MSPASEDEDTTSARPLSRPPVPRSAPRAAMPAGSSLAWGLVGNLHRIEPLSVVPGQSGVVRLVSNTIHYSKPPLEVTWYSVKSEPGRYEMTWPDDPTAVRTLSTIGSDARQFTFNQPLTAEHSLAQELDQAVFHLLKQAELLKRTGWGVGLLTPAGVMIQQAPNGIETVLVDLGFTWKGDFGDPPWDASPGKPAWLLNDDVENPASLVWDRHPVEQQFAQPSGHSFPPAAPGSETRTLARVIAWALTGRSSRTLSGRSEAPVWAVLQDALDGQINSPKELLEALQESRPSSHFYAKPKAIQVFEDEPKKGKLLWIPVVLVVLLLFGLVGFLLFGSGKTTPSSGSPATISSPTTDTPVTSSPPTLTETDAMKLYEQAKSVVDRLKRFADLVKAKPNTPEVQQARSKLFDDWVSECEKEVNLSADASQRAFAGQRLRDLVDQYQKLHTEHPPSTPALREQEKQWIEQYNREAELLGWPR